MFLCLLITAILLQTSVAANLLSSGVFLVRISSEQRLLIHYCFTELPYPIRGGFEKKCLKSGQLDIIDRTETVLDLRITNLTTEYLTVEFNIVGGNGRPIRKFVNHVVVDGALPATRVAIAKGIMMDFVTVCDRPFYGLMCARQCVERDGANYVCDPRGEKVCLIGWTGKDCDIAVEEVSSKKPSEFTIPTTVLTYTTSGRLPLKGKEPSPMSTKFTGGYISAQSSTLSTVVTSTSPSRSPLPIVPSSTTGSFSYRVTTTSSSYSAVITDSAASFTEYVLTLSILAVLIGATGYALTKIARSPLIQNWINRRRARIFAADNGRTSSPQQQEIVDKALKVCVVDVKTAEKRSTSPRYSAEPRRDEEQPSASDTSFGTESHTYHEIDSFFVPPVADDKLRHATLV